VGVIALNVVQLRCCPKGALCGDSRALTCAGIHEHMYELPTCAYDHLGGCMHSLGWVHGGSCLSPAHSSSFMGALTHLQSPGCLHVCMCGDMCASVCKCMDKHEPCRA